MTEAISDTKNRTKKFDAGPEKNVRLVACPIGMIVAMNRMAIEVIVVKAAPSAMTTIAAGRRSSFRSTVAMMAQTRCRRFFFQAEDGIRDYKVTGVQTCALPI